MIGTHNEINQYFLCLEGFKTFIKNSVSDAIFLFYLFCLVLCSLILFLLVLYLLRYFHFHVCRFQFIQQMHPPDLKKIQVLNVCFIILIVLSVPRLCFLVLYRKIPRRIVFYSIICHCVNHLVPSYNQSLCEDSFKQLVWESNHGGTCVIFTFTLIQFLYWY